ncbi:hypothetical protein P3W33_00415 [Luteibacter sp. PPL552]
MPKEGKKIDDLGIAIGELPCIPVIQREMAREDQAKASQALIVTDDELLARAMVARRHVIWVVTIETWLNESR